MSYEAEQRKLEALWAEIDEDAIESESEDDIDHISESEHNTDSEQEITIEDEVSGGNSDRQISETELQNENTDGLPKNRDIYLGKDGSKWNKHVPNQRVRTRADNIITHLPGVKQCAKNAKSVLDCWHLFFDRQIIEDIVRWTNVKIQQKSIAYQNKSIVKATNECEIEAFIGLLYLAGMFRSNRQNLRDLWQTDGTGIDIFRNTMSINRFQFLMACLRFDNIENRKERIKIDKLAPVRGILDKFIENCKQTYTPSQYLTIDEKLESFRGRCAFKQYMPNKPAKYGIKVQALVDARSYYVVNFEVYAGKQPEGPFRLSNSPIDVVERLIQPISGSNRNVTFDNWYTSYELMIKLLKEHKLTSVGTLRKNKRCIPAQFLSVQKREPKTSLFGFQKDITLLSYVPKKNKNVLLMSTMHHDEVLDEASGEKNLPEIISFYNFTKSGVDVVDELSASYNVCRNSRRWPLTIVFSLLNTAAVNALVVYRENNQDFKLPRRLFIKKLGFELIRDQISERKDNPRIPRNIRQQIKNFGQDTPAVPLAKIPKLMGRCSVCPRSRDRKTKYSCSNCKALVCLEHAVMSCQNCMNSDSD